jgi:hypothetical protein
MDDYSGILSCFNYFVKIADRTCPNRKCKRTILPKSLIFFYQISTDQIGSREIIMAGYGYQRPVEPPGKILHESGLTAPRWSFKQKRKAMGTCGQTNFDFI